MTNKSKTLVFFGNEKLATGIPQPKRRILEAVQKAGFNVEQLVTKDLSQLNPHKSQLAVLAAYGQIIPQKILDEFPLGIINVHPSLLPAYRGPTPIEQAILDGATKTGVSIMQLTAKMDEGPIYKQKTIHLTGQESKIELTNKLQCIGAELIVEALTKIFDVNLKPRQQPHPIRATYSKKIFKKDGAINWKNTAIQIERKIRAYLGWPGSYTVLNNINVTLLSAKVTDDQLMPGKIKITTKKELLVGTKKGSLSLLQLQPSGKNKMSAADFINGYINKL
jgi:methionyl-tRNA formyltransferase